MGQIKNIKLHIVTDIKTRIITAAYPCPVKAILVVEESLE